jgi:hypothetical protein
VKLAVVTLLAYPQIVIREECKRSFWTLHEGLPQLEFVPGTSKGILQDI